MRTDPLAKIGERLTRIRGAHSQADFAARLGLHKNTLGTYERAEREMSALALLRVVRLGWNANWVLTGEGPERLDTLEFGEPALPSQSVRAEDLSMAVQLAQEALDGRTLPPPQYGELVALIYDALVHGLPSAQVIALARPAARGLQKGVDDGGGRDVGGEGSAAAGGGSAA